MTFEHEFDLAVGELQMTPGEFWVLTYVEFSEIWDAYRRMEIKRWNERISTAWHTALFHKLDTLPELASLMLTDVPASEEPKGPPPIDAVVARCRMLNAMFGGTEVETNGE